MKRRKIKSIVILKKISKFGLERNAQINLLNKKIIKSLNPLKRTSTFRNKKETIIRRRKNT